MSLNADYRNITDHERVCYLPDGRLNPATEALVFATLFVGMDQITEKTWREFYTRLRIYESALGSFFADGRHFEPEDIRSHIGLKTNVAIMTRARFRNRIDRTMRERIERELKGYGYGLS